MSERRPKGGFGPVKREAGASPARSRRCNEGAGFQFVTEHLLGKTGHGDELKVRRPACRPVQSDHEELVLYAPLGYRYAYFRCFKL